MADHHIQNRRISLYALLAESLLTAHDLNTDACLHCVYPLCVSPAHLAIWLLISWLLVALCGPGGVSGATSATWGQAGRVVNWGKTKVRDAQLNPSLCSDPPPMSSLPLRANHDVND